MHPRKELITITDNIKQINQLLTELVLQPRINAIKWASITKQTPNIKIGYPGQHLASLITGMEGERTGARGNDLIDGTEVKSCSRIDQLDVCRNCGGPVARLENDCSSCGSTEIVRKNDSKWLFSIRSEAELETLVHEVKRVLLIIGDYPNFNDGDYSTLRFQAFEIWPESNRNYRFTELMTNYYNNIYLAHKKQNQAKSPAPKNFWPYQYQFYICNPIPTLTCMIRNANSLPEIEVLHFVEPDKDRSSLPSVLMPTEILKDSELTQVLRKAREDEIAQVVKPAFRANLSKFKKATTAEQREMLIGVNETLRSYLPLRNTDKISQSANRYRRRAH